MANPRKVLPPKVCEYAECGRTFTRRGNENIPRYLARKFCSKECGIHARVVDPVNVKICEYEKCGKEFTRDNEQPGYRRSDFKKRRYCSRSCAGSARVREPKPKKPRVYKPKVKKNNFLFESNTPKWRPIGFPPEPVIRSRVGASTASN